MKALYLSPYFGVFCLFAFKFFVFYLFIYIKSAVFLLACKWNISCTSYNNCMYLYDYCNNNSYNYLKSSLLHTKLYKTSPHINVDLSKTPLSKEGICTACYNNRPNWTMYTYVTLVLNASTTYIL